MLEVEAAAAGTSYLAKEYLDFAYYSGSLVGPSSATTHLQNRAGKPRNGVANGGTEGCARRVPSWQKWN